MVNFDDEYVGVLVGVVGGGGAVDAGDVGEGEDDGEIGAGVDGVVVAVGGVPVAVGNVVVAVGVVDVVAGVVTGVVDVASFFWIPGAVRRPGGIILDAPAPSVSSSLILARVFGPTCPGLITPAAFVSATPCFS